MTTTALARVVELNEGTKSIRRLSFEVGLRALGATAQSMRAGNDLRGFVEVSSQMQSWCRSLATAVDRVTALSTRQVWLVSDIVRRLRTVEILKQAGQGRKESTELTAASDRAHVDLRTARQDLKRLRRQLADGIGALEQLGMMASALSRAALIEASCGTEEQRRELTVVSKGFAERADRVADTIREIISHNRGDML